MTIYNIHAVGYKTVRYISSFHTQREGKFMNPGVKLVIPSYHFSSSNCKEPEHKLKANIPPR